jgi:hypothetical protein
MIPKSNPSYLSTTQRKSAAIVLMSATLNLAGCGAALEKLAGSPPVPAGAKDFPIPNVENDGEIINGIRVNTNGKTIASESLRIVDRVALNSIVVNAISELVQSSAYLPSIASATSTIKLDCTSLGAWVFERKTRASLASATATTNTVDITTNKNLAIPFSAPTAGDTFTFSFNACFLGHTAVNRNELTGTAKVDVQRYSSSTDAIYKVTLTGLRQTDFPNYFGTRSASYTLTTSTSSHTITDYVDGTTKAASIKLTSTGSITSSNGFKAPSRNLFISASGIDSSLDSFKNEPVKVNFTDYQVSFDSPFPTGLPPHTVSQITTIFSNGRRGFTNIQPPQATISFFGGGIGAYLEIITPADNVLMPR